MRTIIKYMLGLSLYLVGQPTLACECFPIYLNNWKADEVNEVIISSELIFIGKAFTVNETKYGFRVIDVFKGDIIPDTILYGEFKTSCSQMANDGLWIVYTKLNHKGLINLELCTLSRNITDPYLFVPPPPPPAWMKINRDSLNARINEHEQDLQYEFIKNWSAEYAILVAYRNKNSKPIPEQKDKGYLSYLAIGLAAIALALVLLKKNK